MDFLHFLTTGILALNTNILVLNITQWM